jgi:hypothetical protein
MHAWWTSWANILASRAPTLMLVRDEWVQREINGFRLMWHSLSLSLLCGIDPFMECKRESLIARLRSWIECEIYDKNINTFHFWSLSFIHKRNLCLSRGLTLMKARELMERKWQRFDLVRRGIAQQHSVITFWIPSVPIIYMWCSLWNGKCALLWWF